MDHNILIEARDGILTQRPLHINTYFEEQILKNTFKEKNPALLVSKAELLNIGKGKYGFSFYIEKLKDIVKDEFNGIMSATPENISSYEAKILALQHIDYYFLTIKDLKEKDGQYLKYYTIFDLDYSKEDIGKTISTSLLKSDVFKDIISTKAFSNGMHYIKIQDYHFLVDKNSKIKAVDTNLNNIETILISSQINDIAEDLKQTTQHNITDNNEKTKIYTEAWSLSCPIHPVAGVPTHEQIEKKELHKYQLIDTQVFGIEQFINTKDIEDHLTQDGKAFFHECLQDNPSKLTSYLLSKLKEEISINPQISQALIDCFDYAEDTFLHKRSEETTILFRTIFDNVPLSELKTNQSYLLIRAHDTSLVNHLEQQKPIDEYVSPFENEINELASPFLENGNLIFHPLCSSAYKVQALGLYMNKEMIKSAPQINLLQKIGENYLFSYAGIETPAVNASIATKATHLKKIENINNPINWSENDKEPIVNTEFSQNFYNAICNDDVSFFNENFRLLDITLHFYQQATLEDKINYFIPSIARCLSSHYFNKEENDKNRAKVWNIVSKDLNNKEISLKDRINLFGNLDKHNLFEENYINYFNVLTGKDGSSGLLKELEEASPPRTELYLRILDKDNRIKDPEIRTTVINKAVQNYWQEKDCYNDIKASTLERKEFLSEIDFLKTISLSIIPTTDRYQFLQELAEYTLSQEVLSLALKPEDIQINTQDKKAITYTYGLETITFALQKGMVSYETLKEFLLGDNTEEALHSSYKKITEEINNYGKKRNWYDENKAKELLSKLTPNHLRQIKKEFNSAPLEAKATIINMITEGNDWRQNFNYVADKLFQDAGDLGNVGKEFLYNYISSRDNSEKNFYLSAIYTASYNKGDQREIPNSPYTKEQRSLAQGLRLFLENSGPAGTKLAQAMSSYNDVPMFIRHEMQKAKSNANPPPRWTVFEWIKNSEKELQKEGKLGKKLGSASFFVTYDMLGKDGSSKVVKILRSGSKIKADREFAIYLETLKLIKDKFKGIETFNRLVSNASSMVDVETNLKIGKEQLDHAKGLYPSKITTDNIEFNFKVMDWEQTSNNWAVMQKAEGCDFNQLPPTYKKTVAKAIFETELANMLSGKRFDSDRHSGQYKIDPQTNTIGIFDTGSISVIEPTEKEKLVLGQVLASTVINLKNNKSQDVASILCSEIDKAISLHYQEELKINSTIPPYLSEFQRGLLALTDFHQEIPPKELSICILNALNNGKQQLDPTIFKGFVSIITSPQTTSNSENVLDVIISSLPTTKDETLTKEAQKGQNDGKLLAQNLIKQESTYQTLIHFPQELKNNDFINDLQNKTYQIHFAKGIVKEIFLAIDPKGYSKEDKQQVGRILYNVTKEALIKTKLKEEYSIPDLFIKETHTEPELGKYAQSLLVISKLASSSEINTEAKDFQKALILGRLLDKDVNFGYKQQQFQDTSLSPISKSLKRLDPISLIPQSQGRKIVKYVIKKIAPKIKEIIKSSKLTDKMKMNLFIKDSR